MDEGEWLADRFEQHRPRLVDAFFAAARAGEFDALVQLLHPDVVLRSDLGAGRAPVVFRGPEAVARLARAPRGARLHPVLVNGAVGALTTLGGRPFSVMAFTVAGGMIVEIDGIRDPDRVRRLAVGVLGGRAAARVPPVDWERVVIGSAGEDGCGRRGSLNRSRARRPPARRADGSAAGGTPECGRCRAMEPTARHPHSREAALRRRRSPPSGSPPRVPSRRP